MLCGQWIIAQATRAERLESVSDTALQNLWVRLAMQHLRQKKYNDKKRLTCAWIVLEKHNWHLRYRFHQVQEARCWRGGDRYLWQKEGLSVPIFILVLREHNEMLQEVIRNYKIIAYLNLWQTECYIELQQLQHFLSENPWGRKKQRGFRQLHRQWHLFLLGACDGLPFLYMYVGNKAFARYRYLRTTS